MADQGKKGFGNQKGKYGNQWQEESANYGKPNKGKGKWAAYQWHQPNITNEWYDEPGTKNGQTAMVGNRTRFTKHRTKVSKSNRLQGSHHPTKEMRLDGFTPMLLSEQT